MFGIACSPRCVKWCSQCWLITNGKLCHAAEIIFLRGCVRDMFVTSYSVTYCLYIPEKPGFFLLLCSLWWVQIVGYVLACRSCSFVCTLQRLIIIIVQTYLRTLKMPVRYILSSVWVKLSIFSVIRYTIHGGYQFTHCVPCDDWEDNIHIIHLILFSSSNRKYEL